MWVIDKFFIWLKGGGKCMKNCKLVLDMIAICPVEPLFMSLNIQAQKTKRGKDFKVIFFHMLIQQF